MPVIDQRPEAPIARPAGRGFTLIELLVVMLIIGVLATLVSLTVSGRAVDDRLQAESRRYHQLLQLAADEAQAKGLELGFRVSRTGIEFLTPDGRSGEWSVVQEGVFRPRRLPPPFLLELRIDGRLQDPVVGFDPDAPPPGDGELDLADDRRIEPQVLILSSGEVTAFTLDVTLPESESAWRVEGNALGQFSSGPREQPA